MKKLLFSFLILFTMHAYGQRATIATPATTIAFYGFENPINITYPGIEQKKLIFTSADTNYCWLSKYQGQLLLRPKGYPNGMCTIYVQNQKGRNIKTIDTVFIPVMNLPKGNAVLGTLGATATLSELLKQDSLLYQSTVPFPFDKDFIISRYTAIIIPKQGYMQNMDCTGPLISKNLKRFFNDYCRPGDRILFMSITASSRKYDPRNIVVNSFSITITKFHSPQYNNLKLRINGYVRHQGKLVPYIYPKEEDEDNNIIGIKDSLWRFFKYDDRYSEFMPTEEVLYDHDKIISQTFYTDSNYRLHYKLYYVDESFSRFESYHRNGKIFQKGNVLLNTKFSEFRKFTYHNYDYKKIEEYEFYLEQTPPGKYPNGPWEVFDSAGKKRLHITWDYKEDSSFWPQERRNKEMSSSNIKHYIIIPVKEYILYKSDGTIEKRVVFDKETKK